MARGYAGSISGPPRCDRCAGDPQPVVGPHFVSLIGFPMSLRSPGLLPKGSPSPCVPSRVAHASLPLLPPVAAKAGWFARLSGQFIILEWCRLHRELLHAILPTANPCTAIRRTTFSLLAIRSNWKNYPMGVERRFGKSVGIRAPGKFAEILRRKAASAGEVEIC